MKQIFFIPILFLLVFTGCSSKKEYYTFGDNINGVSSAYTSTKIIAIEKVKIPKYLTDTSIVYQVSPYRVVRLKKANWLTPMKKRLTNVLIDYLQKSLNNPNIYLYPWESKKKSDIKVSLKIKRFIAYKDEVILEAMYQIKDLKTQENQTKLFNTSIPSSHDTEEIMKSMEKAYFKLIKQIKKDIIK
ncbi:MAG: hypothetical protein DSZ07_01295 [Sulfurovum sp.]|nr:MAG: hypothetical protein DSZ07_01295 [Sulfurovum sp.]